MNNNSKQVHFKRSRFFLFLLLVLCCTSLAQKKIEFEYLSTDQGLSANAVFCIYQDKKGFLWIGTEGGLNRFDGYGFKSFTNHPNNQNSLSDNRISAIIEDNSGRMWVGTVGGGVNVYDREKGMFTRYLFSQTDSTSLYDDKVLSLFKDREGRIWIGTRGGLNIFDEQKKQFYNSRNEGNTGIKIIQDLIQCIFEDKNGNIWVGCLRGLYKYKNGKGTPVHYANDPKNSKSISSGNVRIVFEDRKGRIWIGNYGNGLDLFDPQTETFTHFKHDPRDAYSLSDNTVTSIIEDMDGKLWVGTSEGISIFNETTNKFTSYKNSQSDNKSLSFNNVNCLFKDNSGIVWIGTIGRGLNKYNKNKFKFIHYKFDPDNVNNLNSNFVRTLYEDVNGDVFIGSKVGMGRIEKKTGKYFYYSYNPKRNGICEGTVQAILRDSYGFLWIGTLKGNSCGLCKYDPKKNVYLHYPMKHDDPSTFGDYQIGFIFEDRSKTVWIGTNSKGLYKYDRKKDIFSNYSYVNGDDNSLSNNKIRVIYEDRQGTLWIGTDKGLNKFDKEKNIFKSYLHNGNDPKSLSNNVVTSVCEDTSGNIWVATFGGGLNKLNRESGNFDRYNTVDGLSNNVLNAILCDKNNNLWMSSNNGISRFNIKTKHFRNYDKSDGLQDNEFNTYAYYKSKTGEMFFGGSNGFNRFFPEQITDNNNIPPIAITSFKKYEKNEDLNVDICNIKEIELSYDDDFISFEFAALDYANPDKHQYDYMLEGFNTEWIYNGNRNYASYTNLDGGEYIFKVKGSNNDGKWNEEGTSILLKVASPPWKRWWAVILYFVLIFGSVTLFIHNRTKKQQQKVKDLQIRENELLKLIMEREKAEKALIDSESALQNLSKRILELQEEERHRVAIELHDSVNQILSAARFKILSAEAMNDFELLRTELNKAKTYIDMAVLEVRSISQNLRPSVLDHLGLLSAIKELCYEYEERVRMPIIINSNNFSEKLPHEVESNLYRIVQEALFNIGKHANASEIKINLKGNSKFNELKITDNGKGFDPNPYIITTSKIQNFGLRNMKERARLINAEIEINSIINKGTEIIIRIPVS